MSKNSHIVLAFCAVFFCAALVFAQSYDTCAHLKEWEHRDSDPKEQYDSLRYYIEKCAASDDQSYWAFSSLDGAVQFMSNDTTRFDLYRAWLISVLYLNKTNPAYFCSCLSSIAGTYYGKYQATGYLAVLNYMRQTHPCGWDSLSQAEYSKDSAYDAQHGYDVNHLPSLDSLGLGFLIDPSGVVSPSNPLSSQYLTSFTSSPNPFITESSLEFNLNRMSYVTLSVYDELGRLVWGDGRGSSLEAGMHEVHIDAASFPAARFMQEFRQGLAR